MHKLINTLILLSLIHFRNFLYVTLGFKISPETFLCLFYLLICTHLLPGNIFTLILTHAYPSLFQAFVDLLFFALKIIASEKKKRKRIICNLFNSISSYYNFDSVPKTSSYPELYDIISDYRLISSPISPPYLIQKTIEQIRALKLKIK